MENNDFLMKLADEEFRGDELSIDLLLDLPRQSFPTRTPSKTGRYQQFVAVYYEPTTDVVVYEGDLEITVLNEFEEVITDVIPKKALNNLLNEAINQFNLSKESILKEELKHFAGMF